MLKSRETEKEGSGHGAVDELLLRKHIIKQRGDIISINQFYYLSDTH